jgi:hypothetical protein
MRHRNIWGKVSQKFWGNFVLFHNKMKFEKLSTLSSIQKKLINFDIFDFIGVIISVHNTGV